MAIFGQGWQRSFSKQPGYNHYITPLVPHKAVAEVFNNRKPIGEVGCCESVGVVFFGAVAMVAVVAVPQLLDAVWRSAVAVAVVVAVVAVVVV